ncbi:phage portal protein [Pseudonocardia pini]|uniref:phage portal protein n=1 Tax=Pseudonocardia pini TaxID=2758030 RepID=UPI0015F0A9A3|nr:phage portal protein [Pseudonocardia pini]
MPTRGALAAGRAREFLRNLVYEATDTETGQTATHEVVRMQGGMAPDWGGDATYRGGMGLAGCWRAARLKSAVLATVPWDVVRTRAGVDEKITPRPLFLEQPIPPQTQVDTFSAWHLDLMWHGNAIGIITDWTREGYPDVIVPVPAELVGVERMGERIPGWPVGAVRYWAGGQWWPASRVIHFKGLSRPGALYGMGILEAHLAGTLQLAKSLQEQANSVADHAVPSVLIESLNPDLTPEQAADLKKAYMRSQRTRSPMVLNPATKVTPLAWTPDDAQLIEARNLSLVEQALLFDLDPSWLGAAQTTRTYSNVETEAINLVKFSMIDHFTRFEQTLSLRTPRGQKVEANLDAIMRGDTLTRYQAHEISIRNQWATPDEVRQIEGKPPFTPEQKADLTALKPAPTPPAPGPADGSSPDGESGAGAPTEEQRARDRDGSNLREYWTRGEGLALWATEPDPFDALREYLTGHMTAARARHTAAVWYRIVFGRSPYEEGGA